MNKICTSIEQSKKLIELGIDVNTADMYWDASLETPLSFCLNCNAEDRDYDKMQKYNLIIAWSLSALLGLMPFHIIENNRFGFYQVKGFNKQGETYCFGYKTNNDSILFETSYHNDVADAAFEMICWLLENEKI